ncbi:MAG: TolC family protein [Gemmatimonadetes bacterium]|nr:TolC family protein [Gemmatimonadota bacterium]MYC71135.1 TolC family protein [Gemmatimonadota bacterium]MYI62572.1 TolC family protein [Gemmatimonadota bacterium]
MEQAMTAYRSILAALCCLASVAHAEEWDLTTCQREAGYHSPMLGAARARWNQMRARTRFDYAEQLPTIGLNADYARSEFADAPEADLRLSDSTTRLSSPKSELAEVSGRSQRELFLQAQQEIVRYGATTPSRFAAKHQEQAEKARYREVIIAVDSKVRQAYYRLLLTRDEIASRDELLAYFRAKMDRVQTRLDAGLARPVELHEAELEVLEEQSRINNLQRELRALHLKLFTEIGLVGKRSLRNIEIVGPPYEQLQLLDPSEEDLPALIEEARANRPHLAELGWQIGEQQHQARSVFWQWLPQVGLQLTKDVQDTDLGLNWSGNGQTWKLVGSGRRSLASQGLDPALDMGEGWRVMANVSLPLFQGGRRLARGAEERARLHELRQDRDETRNLIELEVIEVFYDLKSRRENTQILRRRADVARQRLDTAEELFENAMGNLNFDDLRRQRVAVNFAEQSYFAERLAYILAAEELRRILGRALNSEFYKTP